MQNAGSLRASMWLESRAGASQFDPPARTGAAAASRARPFTYAQPAGVARRLEPDSS